MEKVDRMAEIISKDEIYRVVLYNWNWYILDILLDNVNKDD